MILSSHNVLVEALNIPVNKNMRRPPVTVSPTESIASLMYFMVREDIGAVIVEEKGRPIGMITEKDVLDRVVSSDKDLYETKAKDIMSKPIITIDGNRPIKQALDIMRSHNVRRLAVTKNDILIGIVTERRLLEAILSKHA
jgi:CBS domain-containing protein